MGPIENLNPSSRITPTRTRIRREPKGEDKALMQEYYSGMHVKNLVMHHVRADRAILSLLGRLGGIQVQLVDSRPK